VKKYAVAFSAVLLIIATVLIIAAQSQPSTQPPGIAEDSWISLSDSVGIALTPFKQPLIEGGIGYHGTIMIRTDGVWHKLVLDNPPPKM